MVPSKPDRNTFDMIAGNVLDPHFMGQATTNLVESRQSPLEASRGPQHRDAARAAPRAVWAVWCQNRLWPWHRWRIARRKHAWLFRVPFLSPSLKWQLEELCSCPSGYLAIDKLHRHTDPLCGDRLVVCSGHGAIAQGCCSRTGTRFTLSEAPPSAVTVTGSTLGCQQTIIPLHLSSLAEYCRSIEGRRQRRKIES